MFSSRSILPRKPRTHGAALTPLMMIPIAALVLAGGTAYGQPSPVPSGPGGSCPYGWTAYGSYCQPPQGAQGAVPIAPGGGCPYGWAGVGSYCQRPQGAPDAVPVGPGGSCPYGWAGVGSYCMRSGSSRR